MKKIGDIFIEAMTGAINRSLKEATFPDTFKVARVTPIFKGGDSTKCSNYRPVSIIPNPSKIPETVIYNRLEQFARENNLIHENQFGFMKGSSTISAVLTAVYKCIDSVEAKRSTALIFIDIQKAFDCVDHALLLEKLEQLGIRGQMFEILRNYLFARRQKVRAGGHSSEYRYTRCGIPQGSVLSTLLFILFINDVFRLSLRGHLQLFADDAVLVYSCPDLTTLARDMEHDLEALYNWFYNNMLTFNTSKTKYMIIQQTGLVVDTFPTISVRSIPVERVYIYKYLSLLIDHRLRWTEHVDFVKSKIRPFLAVLRRCSYLVPECSKLSLYYSSVHSHFLYLLSIWGVTAVSRLEELARMQNKAIRYIFWREYHHGGLSTADLYRKYRILKIFDLVKYESILTIFRISHGILRTDVRFPTGGEVGVRSARRQSFFYVPRSRTNYHLNSLAHRGIGWYNELPNETRRCHDLVVFKRLLKNHLSRNY